MSSDSTMLIDQPVSDSLAIAEPSSPTSVRGRPRAAFICVGDPEDARTWSGTPLHMLTHLRAYFDFDVVIARPWSKWFQPLRRAIALVTLGRINIYWSPSWAALASSAARQKIADSKIDYVFCVGISPICSLLTATNRAILISDATVGGLIDYNPKFTALSASFRKLATDVETNAVSQSHAAFYPSSWARDAAMQFHHADGRKAHYVHWGANLIADGAHAQTGATPIEWRLLFVGVNWEGKGGDVAVAAVRLLVKMGVRVHLDVVGSQPDDPRFDDPNVTFHGFLNKNNPTERVKLVELFSTSHLLLFPTQFEALGIVSAEAASFGVPTIAYRTGGVAANVVDGETGILLEPGSSPRAWADVVFDLMNDSARYHEMSQAALTWSHNTVNWSTWAATVADVLFAEASPIADKHL